MVIDIRLNGITPDAGGNRNNTQFNLKTGYPDKKFLTEFDAILLHVALRSWEVAHNLPNE